MFPKDKDAQISRFWEEYIEKSKCYDSKQKNYFLACKTAEQYIKTRSARLKAHTALDLDKYFQAKGRSTGLKNWHNVRQLILYVFLFAYAVVREIRTEQSCAVCLSRFIWFNKRQHQKI